MASRKIDDCQLEVDHKRGVMYVHSPFGNTLVRICQIPQVVLEVLLDREFGLVDVVFDRELAKGFKDGAL